jgi:hypothetical protein
MKPVVVRNIKRADSNAVGTMQALINRNAVHPPMISIPSNKIPC